MPPRKDESSLSGNQKQPHQGVVLGFLEWWSLPVSCCHLTVKLIDSFRLYNFSSTVQALTHKHPNETHGGRGAKTAMLTYHKYGILNPRLHLVTF